MATAAASQAMGTITFSSGYFAQITGISLSDASRKAIETSHMGLALAGSGKWGNRTYIASKLNNAGKIKVTFNYNPDTLPVLESAAETVTVALGDSSSKASLAASGFMTDFSFDAPLDDKMTATAEIQLTGNLTKTSGT